MAIQTFLAMTAAEIHRSSGLPDKIGWMACHFSPYSVGLSNLPGKLPTGSLLILNDIIPIHSHAPEIITAQIQEAVEQHRSHGVLLDFQRPDCTETEKLARHLVDALPCPVAVSALYADRLPCPVLLPPLPHHIPFEEHIAPWKEREIWLEIAMDSEEILLTESGAAITPLPYSHEDRGHMDEALHCHYRVELSADAARFTLWRTAEDVDALLEEAESLGITTAVGLYQEFKETFM